MILQDMFNKSIIKQSIECTRDLYPIQNKFINYSNIKEWLVPYIISYEDIEIDLLQKNMKEIIKSQPLLRCTFSNKNNLELNIHDYNEETYIPIYKLSHKESIEDYMMSLSKHLKEQQIYGDILYNVAFLVKESQVYFIGVFNHMITDGGFDFKTKLLTGCSPDEGNLSKYHSYIDKLDTSDNSHFLDYSTIKNQILSEHEVVENNSILFTYATKSLLKHRVYTLEEFWYLTVYNTLFKIFPEYRKLPLCLLIRGRSYEGVIYSKDFGDFHDEIMLTQQRSSSNEEKLSDFKRYKKQPYKNAKEYVKFIKEAELPAKSLNSMEPLILLISGKSDFIDEQIEYKKLVPRDKKHFLSIKVSCYPSLTKFDVSLLFSNTLNNRLKNFEEIIHEEAEKLFNELEKVSL